MANETYIGADGKWTRNNAPYSTYPCQAEEALELAMQIQEKLRGEWQGKGGRKDGVDLGLAAMVLEAYYDIYKSRTSTENFTKLQ